MMNGIAASGAAKMSKLGINGDGSMLKSNSKSKPSLPKSLGDLGKGKSKTKAKPSQGMKDLAKRYAKTKGKTAGEITKVSQAANRGPLKNAQYMADYLTGKTGDFKQEWGLSRNLSEQQAAALMGNFAVETGSKDFANPDVVERNNGQAGRGLAQYSHQRRGPYDQARARHVLGGGDPNDIKWQLKYAGEEYRGLHDPAAGKSLIGWRNTFGNLPGPGASLSQMVKHFERNYFAPSTPHTDRRINEAQNFLRTLNW